jgi:hypothetical protein
VRLEPFHSAFGPSVTLCGPGPHWHITKFSGTAETDRNRGTADMAGPIPWLDPVEWLLSTSLVREMQAPRVRGAPRNSNLGILIMASGSASSSAAS